MSQQIKAPAMQTCQPEFNPRIHINSANKIRNPRGRHADLSIPAFHSKCFPGGGEGNHSPICSLFSERALLHKNNRCTERQHTHVKQTDRQTDAKKYMPSAVSKHPTITEKKQSRRGRPQGPRWLAQGLFRRMCSWLFSVHWVY